MAAWNWKLVGSLSLTACSLLSACNGPQLAELEALIKSSETTPSATAPVPSGIDLSWTADPSAVAAPTYFKEASTHATDQFGRSIAMSADGNTLAVGAFNEGGGALGINGDPTAPGAPQSGAVYVFVRHDGAWAEEAYIKAPAAGSVWFGYNVALSADGSTLAVTQIQDADTSFGSAFVFTRTDATWTQQAHFNADNATAGDAFGWSLGISSDGNTLAVGAFNENSGATGINGDGSNTDQFESGAEYVFVREEGAWTQEAYIKASNTRIYDNFGWSTALSGDGNTLVVGAPRAEWSSGNPTEHVDAPGQAYVFVRTSAGWSETQRLGLAGSAGFDAFGDSAAISEDGSTLAVNGTSSLVLRRSGDTFNVVATPSLVGSVQAISVDGSVLATFAMGGAGSAWFFVSDGTTYNRAGELDSPNPDLSDMFGSSIVMSSDCSTIAIAAVQESSNATGINGNEADNSANVSGAVYAFAR